MDEPIILLFQQDLRIHDNPALHEAAQTKRPLIPLYILDDDTPGPWKPGGASRVYLHHSLLALQESLKKIGLNLILRQGPYQKVLKDILQTSKAKFIYFNRHYEPFSFLQDEKIKKLSDFRSFKANFLLEPWEAKTKQGGYFKVFTRFWNYCLKDLEVRKPLPVPKNALNFQIQSDSLESFKLLPKSPNWAKGILNFWQFGEEAALKNFKSFIKNDLSNYPESRDIPSLKGTAYLSPHLHFGEISPYTIWHLLGNVDGPAKDKFLSEIFWREFSMHLLYHFPKLPEEPFVKKFSAFPWSDNLERLTLWQKGQTGYPIVDAGMRQLWQIGWMHNRVRMIVASFLTKDLIIPWQKGEAWFWDTLVDADLANNSASWQWVAGCGADAAPYFRIFNPILQGQKFDPKGDYIKTWIPELVHIPAKYIHDPWNAPPEVLKKAGVTLGINYPRPLVNHNEARTKALDLFKKIK